MHKGAIEKKKLVHVRNECICKKMLHLLMNKNENLGEIVLLNAVEYDKWSRGKRLKKEYAKKVGTMIELDWLPKHS